MGIVRTGVMSDGGAVSEVSVGDAMADELLDIFKGDDGCEVDLGPS